MTAWVKRRYQADKALDTAMGSVVEYYQFSSMKAPPPPPEDALSSSLFAPSPVPPPTTSPTPSSSTLPPSPSPFPSPSPSSLLLTYPEWQSERAEMLSLDRCTVSATWRILSTASFSGLAAAIYRHRQGKGKVVMAMSGGGFFLFTAALSWSFWGKRCASEFLTSEGRVAERGRAVLRREMEDHPLLAEYEEKHRTREKNQGEGQAMSEGESQ